MSKYTILSTTSRLKPGACGRRPDYQPTAATYPDTDSSSGSLEMPDVGRPVRGRLFWRVACQKLCFHVTFIKLIQLYHEMVNFVNNKIKKNHPTVKTVGIPGVCSVTLFLSPYILRFYDSRPPKVRMVQTHHFVNRQALYQPLVLLDIFFPFLASVIQPPHR